MKARRSERQATQFILYLYFLFVSVQAFTSLRIRVCVQRVTAIPRELHSVIVRARPDNVCVQILQWEGSVVTSVMRCSTDSTLAWAGNSH